MAENLGSIYAELRLSFAKIDDDIKKATAKIGAIADSFKETGNSVQKAGKNVSKVGSTLTKKVTLPIVGLGTAFVKLGSDFDETMSAVQAISGATGDEFEKLREQAMHLGATTQFSAQDAADGMVMLARAGWDVDSIMATMPGLLHLAAAGNLDLATASSITADTMSVFNMSMEDSVRAADVFAKGANSANTTVELLGESMAYGGASAAAAGMDIEQTVAIFAAFADAGIKGSRAGTVFEAVMRDMRDAVEDGHIAIGDTSIAVYDAEGNMRSLTDIMLDVEEATAGMTTEQRDAALAAIFNTQALRGVNVMLQTGVGNIKDFEGELYNSQGTADSTAAIMRDNLKGAVEELTSAFEGLAIEFSDILTPLVRDFVERLTDLIQKFIELDDSTKETIVKIAAIAAVVGPVILIIGKFIEAVGFITKGIGYVISAIGWLTGKLPLLGKLFTSIKGAVVALATALGLPAWAVVAIIAAIVALTVVIVKNWDAIKEWLAGAWEAIVKFFTTTLPEAFQSAIEWFGELGTKTGEFFSGLWESITDWAKGIWESVTTWFGDMVTSIGDAFSDAWAAVTEWVIGIWESITEWIGNAVTSTIEWFQNLPTTIATFFENLWTSITMWVTNIYNSIIEWFGSAIEWLRELPGKILEALYVFFTETLPYTIGYGLGVAVRFVWDAIVAIVQFFAELPEKIWTWITVTATNIWEWAVGIYETVSQWFSDTIDSIVTFFSELPGKIWDWLVKTATDIWEWASGIYEDVKKWFNNAIANIVTYFKELPGKIWGWLVKTATDIYNWAVGIRNDVYNWFKKAVDSVVTFFSELPGRIWGWITKTATDIYNWAVGIRNTVREWFSNVVNTVVTFISELPGKIWTWLQKVINDVKTWASNIWKTFRQAAVDLVNGFIGKVKELPGLVWDAILGIKNTIVNAATSLFNAAKKAASNLWNGFKKGLGIASPSYLEEAMMDIMDKSYEMTTQLGGDFKKLSRMSVKPEVTPFSPNPERDPNWGGGGPVPVGAGGFSGPLIQIEKMEVRNDRDVERISENLKQHVDSVLRSEGIRG